MIAVWRHPIVLTWLLCGLLVGAGAATVAILPEVRTPFEDQSLDRLERLADAEERIVILGDSLIRSAIRHSPTLEDRLRDAGRPVRVADLAVGGGRLEVYERLFDEIIASDPTIIIVQHNAFSDNGRRRRSGLNVEVRRLIGRAYDEPLPFGPPRCRKRAEAPDADRRIEVFGRPSPWFDLGEEFIRDAAAAGIAVYLVEMPRSQPLLDQVEQTFVDYRAMVTLRFGQFDNVTFGPRIEVGDLAYYCDYAHLNAPGQDQFLDIWLPEFEAYLDTLTDGS